MEGTTFWIIEYNWNKSLDIDDASSFPRKGVERNDIDHLHETYKAELAGKDFAHDGEKPEKSNMLLIQVER